MTAHHDAQERLTVEEVEGGGLLAASHVHRYEVAAAALAGGRVLDLCCGTGYGSSRLAATAESVLGVDLSEEAVAVARATLDPTLEGRVSFEAADALAFLRGCGAERFDAIVCFEGIEHVPHPEALVAELARLAESGVRLLVSLPNSKGFDEENEFHLTDFGYEEMRELIAPLPEPVLLEQRLAEASLIMEAHAQPSEVVGHLEPQRDGIEWANHWLIAVGIPSETLRRATARLAVVASAQASRYLRILEKANAELLRQNARLSRDWLGMHDAAAAAVLRRLGDENADARKWKEIADNNDFARQGLQRRLDSPGHRMVERVRTVILGVPGVGRALRSRRDRAS